MVTTIGELGIDMILEVAAHRDWVEGWIGPESHTDYTDPNNMVALVGAILRSGQVSPDETVKLRALGTYLGLAINGATGWPIKQATDEHGTDLAVVYRNPDGMLFPQTLISKRIEAGQEINVFELVNGLISMAQDVLTQDN
jgi:hypothetical protein